MNNQLKSDCYRAAITDVKHMFSPDGYRLDMIGKMAIMSAVLKIHFPEWVFVGFYRSTTKDVLEIGPYQGSILACGRIKYGRGVCGIAALKRKTVIVADVDQFPGYLACDNHTKSEIVIPVIRSNELIAVLDIDAARLNAFDETDRQYLEEFVTYL